MHILSTEGSLPKLLADALPGDYHALTVNGLAFDIAQDKFKLVQSIEGQVAGSTWCAARRSSASLHRRGLLGLALVPLVACDEAPPPTANLGRAAGRPP